MRARKLLSLMAFSLCAWATPLWPHCEIPCGIYGDDLRFSMIEEHAATIEKSMQQIAELAGKTDAQSANQLARWVANKEKHADEVQHVVAQYFLTQRIKVPEAGGAPAAYTEKLVLLHQMLVAAMKCKQTVEVAHVEKLRQLLHEFKHAYEAK
jgi:nickel superoxide dismutase